MGTVCVTPCHCRGLRACIGLHTGVKPQNMSYSGAAKRTAYGGLCLRVARAVAAAAYGTASRVLLSGACFKQLGAGLEAERGVTVLNVGEFVLDRPFPVQNPLNLYMVRACGSGVRERACTVCRAAPL